MFLYQNAHQGRVPNTTQWVLLIQQLLDIYENLNGGSKHNGVGIFIMMKMLKCYFIKIFEDACFTRK
jgi:hypothetical protein